MRRSAPRRCGEYHAEGVNAPTAMIRDGSHKLIVCRTDPDQLYDLEADPRELVNLAGDAEHAATVSSLRDALASRLDLAAIEDRMLESQRERRLVVSACRRARPRPGTISRSSTPRRNTCTREDLYDLQRAARFDAR
jgi:choline-sulfatase